MINHKEISNFKLTPQWLAGFFDGEGCIGLYKIKARKNCYALNIKISQKDEMIIAFIYIHFPDAILKTGHEVKEIDFCNEKVQLQFLNYIKDYSIVKRTQILLALDYLNDRSKGNIIAEQLKNEKFDRKQRVVQ